MNHKEYIKKLRQKRKGKVNQIQKYFETYYPNLKLTYSIGNMIKIKYKGKIFIKEKRRRKTKKWMKIILLK